MEPCPSATHSRSDYNEKKCNCEQGRRANAEYVARKKADNKARTASQVAAYRAAGGRGPDPTIQHGTAACHEWRGCQEPDCIAAARDRWKVRSRTYRFIKRITLRKEALNG